MVLIMMCSGQFLETEVKNFCNKYNKDEGFIWTIINDIHTRDYGRNILWEKQKEEKEKNLADIPMSQYFAKCEKVSNAIYILKGLENCCENGWELK